MADLVETLLALQHHLKCTKDHLYEVLLACAASGETFASSTFSDAINGRRPHSRKAGDIAKAVEVYVTGEKISVDHIVQSYADTQSNVVQPGIRKVPIELKGAWFLVQYRGRRGAGTDVIAKADHRIGILVYGANEKSGRKIEIIGQSTTWRGHVSMNPQDDLLYYSAHEIQRPQISEWVRMLMHAPYAQAEIADHHGILLGTARGPHDSPDYPIYASGVLLSRIENEKERGLVAPLNSAEIITLKKYCGYFPRFDAASSGASAAEDNDILIAERNRAIRCFEDRGTPSAQARGNYGDRIFVRF